MGVVAEEAKAARNDHYPKAVGQRPTLGAYASLEVWSLTQVSSGAGQFRAPSLRGSLNHVHHELGGNRWGT